MTALELWGPGEIKNALKVSGVTLKRWRDAGTFPEPIASLSIGDVWLADDVRAWSEIRNRDADARTDQTQRRRAETVRAYRRTGSVSETARVLDVSRSTVIDRLVAAGEPLPRQ